MHITVINGSQRRKPGFTADLIDSLVQGAVQAGATTETINLAKLEVRPCLSCGLCQSSGTGSCAVHAGDGAELAFAAMRRADLVVYASPIYVFSFSSLLKSLIERFYGIGHEASFLVTRKGLLFHGTDREVCGKPFAVVLTADNSERETPLNAERYFRSFSRFLDAPLAGMLVRGGGRFIRSGKAAVSLDEVRDGFYQAGRELALSGRVSRGTEKRIRRSAIPVPKVLLSLLKLTPGGRKTLVSRAG